MCRFHFGLVMLRSHSHTSILYNEDFPGDVYLRYSSGLSNPSFLLKIPNTNSQKPMEEALYKP